MHGNCATSHPMRPLALALVAFVGGFAGNLVSSGAVKQACAEGLAITLPVPSEGVVFRTPGGRVVARLRSESGGGVFELLDAREKVGVRLRATGGAGAVELGQNTSFGAPAPGVIRSTDDSGY